MRRFCRPVAKANLSKLKSGHVKGVKLETLDKICAVLDCKPGDLLDHAPGEDDPSG
ncbi:MAG: helix-turn-helix domain-containing protein [Sphingomonadaceae bacterium]|nr:helix-turn-helix domain-containing protein [Sphingomonadaceae bacterium]